ncbi:MAG: peptide ABC transporter substrate-binding protein, partial [Ruthenibacterium sp.]
GAYYLSDFAPQQTRVFTKNPSYWDKDKVFITTIEETYNAESGTIGPEMAKRGEIDQADISSDLLDSWLSN